MPAPKTKKSNVRKPQTKSFIIYVPPTGTPLAETPSGTNATASSIHEALEKIRRIRKGHTSKDKGSFKILMGGGWHFLEKTIEIGPDDSHLVIAAAPGERPILSGGIRVEKWQQTTLNGLSLWETELDATLWKDPVINQIFVNNIRRFPARLPVEGFFRFAPSPQSDAATPSFHDPVTEAYYSDGTINPQWHNLSDIRLTVFKSWTASHFQIKKIDPTQKSITVRGAGFFGAPTDAAGKPAPYWVENVSEGMVREGIFYHDKKAGKLSYLPCWGDRPDNTVAIIPHLRYLVRIQGHPLKKRVENVRFENIDFRHAAYAHQEDYSGPKQADFTVPGAIVFYGAQDCGLYGCSISQCAQYAVEFRIGCTDNRVVGCHLHDLGGGGVKIMHELGARAHRHVPPDEELDLHELGWLLPGMENDYHKLPKQKVLISDCHIEDAGKIFLASIGIWVGEATGNTIRHNEIRHLNYSGISLGWCWGYDYDIRAGDNLVEFNHIHHLNCHRLLDDIGGIYTLGPQPGSILRGNHIHDIHRNIYGNWGIYHDNGSSFILDEHNALHHCTYGAYNINDARDIRARYNIAIMDNDPDNSASYWSKDPGVRTLLAESNIYVSQPPQVIGAGSFFGHVTFRHNIFWDHYGRILLARRAPEGISLQEWLEEGYGKGDLAVDPLISITRDGLPVLSQDSPAIKKQGFKPLDLSTSGPRFETCLPQDWGAWVKKKEPLRPCIMAVLLCQGAVKEDCPHGHPGNFVDQIIHPSGKPIPFSLCIANKGELPVEGKFRVTTDQPRMATFKGSVHFTYQLAPGCKKTFHFSVVLSPGAKRVLIEAIPVGKSIPVPTALFIYADKAPPMIGEKRLAPGQWT